jgi:hypothetical protein
MPKRTDPPFPFRVEFKNNPMEAAYRARQRRTFDFAALRARIAETLALAQTAQAALESKRPRRAAEAQAAVTSVVDHLNAIHRELAELTRG